MESGQEVSHLDGNHEVNQHEFFLQCMEHRPTMISYAKRLMGAHFAGDVEDLIQDVLIKAALHVHQFKTGTNLRAWLFKITYHSFMNHQRKAKRTVLCDPSWEPENMGLPTPDKSPVRPEEDIVSLHAESMRFKLKIALDNGPLSIEEVDSSILELIKMSFPPVFAAAYEKVKMEFRVVFALVDIMEFEYTEVEALLGMPMGTVMSRIFRGRNALAKNPKIKEIGGLYGLSRVDGKRAKTK